MAYKRNLDVYLLLERSKQYKQAGNMNLISATTNPPTRRPAKSVLVKVKVLIPDEAFDPAKIPALIADIPLDLLQPAEDQIDVVIDDANA